MFEHPVYGEPISSYEVISNQSKDRKYLVCFGEVNWGDDRESEYAVYIRVLTMKDGIWRDQNSLPHFLVNIGEDGKSDFDRVHEKMESLKKDHLSKHHY